MNEDSRGKLIELEKALAVLRTPEEARQFLEALMTPTEIASVRNRWFAMQLALRGTSQRSIRHGLNISIATASRYARATRDHSSVLGRVAERATTRKARKQPSK